ncbi:hypothetical protein EHM69_06125 [candidate division KSB1 bacterium]|nr:MAG: hypothetical protein EHM69_06125 [candidate division KSB1 bacterium]
MFLPTKKLQRPNGDNIMRGLAQPAAVSAGDRPLIAFDPDVQPRRELFRYLAGAAALSTLDLDTVLKRRNGNAVAAAIRARTPVGVVLYRNRPRLRNIPIISFFPIRPILVIPGVGTRPSLPPARRTIDDYVLHFILYKILADSLWFAFYSPFSITSFFFLSRSLFFFLFLPYAASLFLLFTYIFYCTYNKSDNIPCPIRKQDYKESANDTADNRE